MRTINLALTIFSILFLVTTYQAIAQKQQLSDQAVISLITADPGEELYSLFGHSAIRVKDTVNNQDLVFNYGRAKIRNLLIECEGHVLKGIC
jgi:hypothetical protein